MLDLRLRIVNQLYLISLHYLFIYFYFIDLLNEKAKKRPRAMV